MRSVDEHLRQCLAAVAPLAPIDVALLEALDCVLAEDVVASGALPSFDGSAMDGYAVRVEDVAGASAERPVVLPVVADYPAGVREVATLVPGTTARIMTGAPVPPGATAVVPVEWTDAGIASVTITGDPAPGQHVRRAGEDVAPGEVLLRTGTRLGVRSLALLAAAGRDRVAVHPRPRVVVLSTGSELVDPGRHAGFGQVTDSNSTTLTAAALDAGALAYRVGIVSDDAHVLLQVLEDQRVRADVLVTSGGVSAGAYDVVKEVLSRLGTVSFDKVAMQPGMPQGLGTLGGPPGEGTPIFTLPGNPVSAYVSFEVFVRPALRRMLGHTDLQRPVVTATAARGWRSPPGKRQFARAVLTRGDDGAALVRPVGGQGSHLVADLSTANALAVVDEGTTEVREGDAVRCTVLEEGWR